MLNLKDYDVTPERGFLTPHDMEDVSLPKAFDAIVETGRALPDIITTGRIRHLLKALPEVDMAAELPKLSDAQLRLLMVHYSFIMQAYVWGEEKVPEKLPRNIAVPYCLLAEKIGQFPLLPYSAYTLDN